MASFSSELANITISQHRLKFFYATAQAVEIERAAISDLYVAGAAIEPGPLTFIAGQVFADSEREPVVFS